MEADVKRKELLMESKAELIERARELDLPGRSKMSKEELAAEIEKALGRVDAARRRRARTASGATPPARKATSSRARRAIEERTRRNRAATAQSGISEERVRLSALEEDAELDESRSGTGVARRVKPSRASKRKSPPPGAEQLDLDAGSSASGTVSRPPSDAPQFVRSRVPEDRLSGGPLAKTYGRNKFVLLTRDPRWLFAYWEILPESEEKVRRTAGDDLDGARRILRVYDVTESGGAEPSGSFDLQIHPGAKSWYIHLPTPGRIWRIELGYIGHSGRFYRVLGSNTAKTPRKSVSNVVDEEYRTLDEEFDEIFRLSGGHIAGSAAGGIGGSAAVARKGGKGRKGRAAEEEAPERWMFPFPTSGGMWSGMPYASGVPSQPAPPVKPGDDFFFWVNCELILYGGTQPTATVTVQGQRISLRPDGTFTLRYALPDGKIELPVVATRADGKQKRRARPIVTRVTK
jgi:hypothetical protein